MFCQVESRDVLGNIKGSFGFVDADGEIKRVSYSSSNGTGFKSTTMPPLQEHVSVVQSIPRVNRTATTKKPAIVYATTTTTEAPTKSSVVQSIPRIRKPATSTTAASTSTASSTEAPKTIFAQYLKGTAKNRPRFVINGQQRPIVIEDDTEDEDSQINRPSTDDKSGAYRRIILAKRPIEHSLPPISEDFVEKEDEAKITTGNSLRRQLHDETTKNSGTSDDGDDHSDVYGAGGSLSTTRPLFTTTVPPRLLQRVSTTSRPERPKIYVNRENLGGAGPKYDGSRVYEAETKPIQEEERTSSPPILLRTSTARVPVENNREYLRQTTEPVFVRPPPEQYLRELPPRLLVQSNIQSNLDEEGIYRAVPIGRILLRPPPGQQPVYPTTTDANVHYLTENPAPDQEEDARIAMNNYMRARPVPVRPLIYPEPEQRVRPILRPVPSPVPHPDDRDYQSTTPEYPYRPGGLALPPEPPNPIAPPLSRRDFQTLLRRLLVSQYGVQALAYPKTYLEDALYDQQPYPSYPAGYRTPLPRPDLAYEQQVQYGDRVSLRRPVYTRALSPVYPQYDDYHDGRYSKRVYRQKFYTHDMAEDGDEILPAPIREALLLRMVNLAINAERSTMMPTTVVSTTTPTSRYRKKGPIRSVQIITDDEEEEKDMRKKM